METKFTPGPWSIGYNNDEQYSVMMGSSLESMNAYECQHVWSCYLEFDDDAPDEQHEEAEANSYLIAAAPDLYEALDALFKEFKELADSGDCGNWSLEELNVGKQAIVALAKARGEDNE